MEEGSVPSRPPVLALWHVFGAMAVALLPAQLRMTSAAWRLPTDAQVFLSGLVLAYLAAAAALWANERVFGSRNHGRHVLAAVSVAYAMFAAALLMTEAYASRLVLAASFVLAVPLASLPYLFPKATKPLFPLLAVSVAAVGIGPSLFGSAATDSPEAPADAPPITTAFYDVRLAVQRGAARSEVRGGGVEPLGDDFLLVTGDGVLRLLSPAGDSLLARELPYAVPFNRDVFKAAVSEEVASRERFRVLDLLVLRQAEEMGVLISHHHWDSARECFVLRISRMDAPNEAFVSGHAESHWRTVFDTSPCLPVVGDEFNGHSGGGRLAALDDRTILLSVGDYGFDGLNLEEMYPQDPEAHYGKTLLIDLHTGEATVYTLGHRNPQGLTRTTDGEIWLAEHGPRGGDELNLLEEGTNYGWPLATYGTNYGALEWPLSKTQGSHFGFRSAEFSWTPSAGVSSLIEVRRDMFPIWKGDLLVASLSGAALFRVRREGGHVVYAEPIPVGGRVRDLAEGSDGRLLLVYDDSGDLGLIGR